jgi:hypothetical protein
VVHDVLKIGSEHEFPSLVLKYDFPNADNANY